MKRVQYHVLLALLLLVLSHQVCSQHFGRNKPHYESFDFKVKQSPHFDLHHYFPDDSLANDFLAASEQWYSHQQKIFRDTFPERNPIILYANHADFQQTTAIMGNIGVGTGGVTEALKNRIAIPVMELNSQTHHVLGHELVHAFQYKMFQRDSLRLTDIQNIPLWMVEGLAEYLSLGNVDPNTAMWMRDALVNNDFPTLKDLTRSYKYFPYRYGQAFWSFATGVYGDTIVHPLFLKTAKLGYADAIKEVTGLDEKAFSEAWKRNLTEYYSQFKPLVPDSLAGRLLISNRKAGDMNIAPVLSPNGQYLAFLSQKNFFSVDLFLADARTGKILKTLSSTARESHIDDFSFIESGGSWSPFNDRFAFAVFSKGQTMLSIAHVNEDKVTTVAIPGVPYFSNPSWSPDGQNIVVSGLVNGRSDLFLYDLKNNATTRLTGDLYSDIQPQWSPDGEYVLFVSDRPASDRPYRSRSLQLCLLNVKDKKITVLDIFNQAENLNPVFSPDGTSIYYLSDRDGFRNLYRYDLSSEKVYQLTNYVTGISGITAYSPAITISKNGLIGYTYYADRKYSIYIAKPEEFRQQPVRAQDVNFSAGILPTQKRSLDIVNQYLDTLEFNRRQTPLQTTKSIPYKPRLSLEYIGNEVGAGVTTNSFGTRTGMQGGVNMLFGDMLGYNKLFTSVALNGEIYDFGMQTAYLNQRHKVNWGIALGHTPYRSARLGFAADTLYISSDTLLTTNVILDVFRAFEESATAFMSWPITTTRRIEAAAGYSNYSFRLDRFNYYYYYGYKIREEREKLDAPEAYSLGNVYTAYVFDNSYFGVASPLRGKRYRIELEKTYDALDYHTVMLDYRRYFFLNPTSFAFRVMHIGRHGKDAESNLMYPLSFAYPTYTRGNSLDDISRYDIGEDNPAYSINQIYGSRIAVANAEWRIPFTGPERLSRIKSKIFLTEFALFADAGLAWNSYNVPRLKWRPESVTDRIPFLSAGVSLRVNVFGLMVIEPYYAFPWRGDRFEKAVFGINFSPGW